MYIYSGAEVGLEEVVHGVSESLGAVLLCAVVSFPLIECPIEFPFNLSFSTCDRLAGKILMITFVRIA